MRVHLLSDITSLGTRTLCGHLWCRSFLRSSFSFTFTTLTSHIAYSGGSLSRKNCFFRWSKSYLNHYETGWFRRSFRLLSHFVLLDMFVLSRVLTLTHLCLGSSLSTISSPSCLFLAELCNLVDYTILHLGFLQLRERREPLNICTVTDASVSYFGIDNVDDRLTLALRTDLGWQHTEVDRHI